MPTLLQDALLPMLLAGVIGLLAGGGIALLVVVALKDPRRHRRSIEPERALWERADVVERRTAAAGAAPDAAPADRELLRPARPPRPSLSSPPPEVARPAIPAEPAGPAAAHAPASDVPFVAAVPALPQVADLLLVDDSAVARAKLRKLFESAGYAVHLARDGVEALALLEAGRYALMITDLEMPNMDGVALINECLARPPTAKMPILAISGHEGLRAKFNECRDICGIHRKPWVDDILLSHVAALVASRHGHVEALVG